MSSVTTVFNPKEHCPWLGMLCGSYGSLGHLGDNAIFEIGADDNGVDVKFYGSTSGSYLLWDQSNDELTFYRASFTENQNAIDLDVYPTDTTHGCRQGALSVTMRRDTVLASWDGNGDIAMRVYAYNYAANGTSAGGARGMEVLARNRTGSCSWVNGAYITAENYTGSAGIASMTALEVHAKNNGTASGDVKVLRVYDESQSYTGTTYGIELSCTGDSGFEREYGFYINAGATASWANAITFDGGITNVLDFADSDGTNGATYAAGHLTPGNCDAKIKIDVGGHTLYLAAYDGIT